jgi:Replication-relaxation
LGTKFVHDTSFIKNNKEMFLAPRIPRFPAWRKPDMPWTLKIFMLQHRTDIPIVRSQSSWSPKNKGATLQRTLVAPKSKQLKTLSSLTPVDTEILQAVWFHHFITAEQLLRHRERSSNGLPKMQEKLKWLYEQRYLDRFSQPRYQQHGSLPFVYLLASNGIKYLSDQCGIEAHVYYWPSDNAKRSPLDVPHDLALNEVLIAARHLEKFEPHVLLSEARHEWMLRQETYKVTLYRKSQTQLIPETVHFTPDGFLDFRITAGNQPQQACILLEMDMNTHQKPRFQKKIASYVAFINEGLYKQTFKTSSVVIAFVTPTGEKRREQMKLWCEEQLQATPVYHSSRQPTNGMDDASLFLFGSVPSGGLHPPNVFLSPVWYAPFDNKPQALLVI